MAEHGDGGHEGHVRKVIRVVATSSESWEEATARGVGEAAKTIRDLSTARLVRRDVVLREGAIASYRVQLEVSFQLDRYRPGTHPGDPMVRVRRYLVVANQTLTSPGLTAAIEERHSSGPAEFHLVVPATLPSDALSGLAMSGDPFGGSSGLDPGMLDQRRGQAVDEALARLQEHLASLRSLGVDVTSEVGPADPFQAVMEVMGRSSFDEIVISTLPHKLSKWLHVDLPSRVGRATDVPISVYTPAED